MGDKSNKSQLDRFKEAARELETDDEAKFNENHIGLGKLSHRGNFSQHELKQQLGYFPPPTRARGGVLVVNGKWEDGKPCGALTRKGTACRAKAINGKGRCKFHGGMSTGPKTPEGRERIAEAQRRRWSLQRG